MKLHFCEAIEIENLKQIDSERDYKIWLDHYIWKKFTLKEIWQKIQKYLIGKKSFAKNKIGKDLNRKDVIRNDWFHNNCWSM